MQTPQTPIPSAHAFVDGQNLFYAVKAAFGYRRPNFDVRKLAEAVCAKQGWRLGAANFYTGIPEASDDPFWNYFWRNKLAVMGRQGVKVFSRHLRYRNQTVRLPDGSEHVFLVGQEKGVDVRIALDVVRTVHRRESEVVVIFSQDQDLSEAVDEARLIANEQGRSLIVASAFPSSPAATNARGINKTNWIRIDRATYDDCLDRREYRPAKKD